MAAGNYNGGGGKNNKAGYEYGGYEYGGGGMAGNYNGGGGKNNKAGYEYGGGGMAGNYNGGGGKHNNNGGGGKNNKAGCDDRGGGMAGNNNGGGGKNNKAGCDDRGGGMAGNNNGGGGKNNKARCEDGGGGGQNKNDGNANGGGGGGQNKNAGNGKGGQNKKAEELQPHPAKELLPGVEYCVNSPPPWSEAIILGFQHYLLALGITVLIPSIIVPQMGGGNTEKLKVIQTLLFVSGLSTLFQSLFGTRLPTVVVGSYAYIIPTTSIVLARRYNSYTDPHERFVQTMRGIQGALILTGVFQTVLGFLGLWRNIVRLLSPLSLVPLVTFTGLGLYHLGFPLLGQCVEVGLPGLILMVFISQYLHRFVPIKRAICERFAVLFSVAIVWLFAEILTLSTVYNNKPEKTQISCRTDRAGLLSTSTWIYIPHPFQWGRPTFSFVETLAMMAASFVSLVESTGTFFVASRYGAATPVPPSVISRGIAWQGIGVMMNGMFGSVTGCTASVENVGLLALTRSASRRVVQVSAVFMILFSVFGKVGAFFASVPLPIVAALYCILIGYVSSAGLGFLQFCNLNSFKTKFVLGFSLFMGISVPQYFREYYQGGIMPEHGDSKSSWFNNTILVIFMSHATVAALVALFLDCTMARENEEMRGLKWWQKFSLYNSDSRSDEFYALPWGLNKLFPAV